MGVPVRFVVQDGESSLVVAVQEEQSRIAFELLHASAQEGFPALEGDRPRPELLERFVDQGVHAKVQGEKDVGLAREVVVEGCLGDPKVLGDLPQGGPVVPLLGEELERYVEDALPRTPVASHPRRFYLTAGQ